MKILSRFFKKKEVSNKEKVKKLLAAAVLSMSIGTGTNANAAPIDPNLIKGIAGSVGTVFNESYYSLFYSPDSANVNTLEAAEKAVEYIKLKTKFDYILNKSLKIINSKMNDYEKMKKFNIVDSYELKGIRNSTYLILFINSLLESKNNKNLKLTQKEEHFLELQKLALMGYLAKMTMFMEKNSFANRKIITDVYKMLKNSKIFEPTYADVKVKKNFVNTEIHHKYEQISETIKKIFEKEEVIEMLAKEFKTSKKEIKKFVKFAFANKEIQMKYNTPNVSHAPFGIFENPTDMSMFFYSSKDKKEYLEYIKQIKEKERKLIEKQEKVEQVIREKVVKNNNINYNGLGL